MNKKFYNVWVGGTEVNDYPLSKKDAQNLQDDYIDDGYIDTEIVENKDE